MKYVLLYITIFFSQQDRHRRPLSYQPVAGLTSTCQWLGQRDKGRGSPSPTSPAKSPKLQAVSPLSNGDVPSASSDGSCGPLSGLSQDDLCGASGDCEEKRSRLSKTLSEVVADKGALGYFIQYLEARDGFPLIKFWLDAESFRSAASSRDRKLPDCDGDAGSVLESPLHSSGSTNDVRHSEVKCCECGCEASDESERASVASSRDGTKSYSSSQLTQATVDDSLRIFNKYISHEATHPIKFPEDLRDRVVASICQDAGMVEADCFAQLQHYVFHVMEKEYFHDFLRSDFHCKHQIDVLTSGNVVLADILFNETALFYFMEYMEQEGNQSLVEFWLAAVNFQQHLNDKKNYDPIEAQNDAIVLYDKTKHLPRGRPLAQTVLEGQPTLCSMFSRRTSCSRSSRRSCISSNLSELINTIQASPALMSRTRKSGSECGSECNVSLHNTLLAMEDSSAPPRKIIRNVDDREMSIDSRQLYDPDSLWRRRHQASLNFGRINEMGRFESDVEPEPDRKEESRITRVVRKLVNMEEDKAKEEMAWQIAEMIVKDITNLTLGESEQVQS
ncbi:hypothetical protein L9F63_025041 [Diploptera punctata]|uniref:RGS domain-containing protein n=1 Tax=Diploptera punctata TaxID=6984 RepID=A0AAD7ZCG1_DIPPU|nr:hypothetical protein L9F63_025041 [Diploptera punctata]